MLSSSDTISTVATSTLGPPLSWFLSHPYQKLPPLPPQIEIFCTTANDSDGIFSRWFCQNSDWKCQQSSCLAKIEDIVQLNKTEAQFSVNLITWLVSHIMLIFTVRYIHCERKFVCCFSDATVYH